MLQDFTVKPLRSEFMAVRPTRRGGNPGEVSSYLEWVKWIIRMHADDATVAGHVDQFDQARKEEKEDEMSYAERLEGLNTACGFLHSNQGLSRIYLRGTYPGIISIIIRKMGLDDTFGSEYALLSERIIILQTD